MVIKIPPDAEPGIYARAGEGKTLAEICEWLHKTHGVRVSPTAIRKKLAKRRKEREVVAKAVVREVIAKTVTTDLDVLAKQQGRLAKLATRHFNRALKNEQGEFERKSPTELYCLVVEQLRKVAETKLHFSGADAPDDAFADIRAAEARLARGMAGVRARLKESGVPLPDDAPGEGGAQLPVA